MNYPIWVFRAIFCHAVQCTPEQVAHTVDEHPQGTSGIDCRLMAIGWAAFRGFGSCTKLPSNAKWTTE